MPSVLAWWMLAESLLSGEDGENGSFLLLALFLSQFAQGVQTLLRVGDPCSDNSSGLLLRAPGSCEPQGLATPRRHVQAGKGSRGATLGSAAISPVGCTETMSFLADKCSQACTGGNPAYGPLLPLHPPGNTQHWEQGPTAAS